MYIFKELKRACKNITNEGKTVKVALLGDTATQFLATAIKGDLLLRGFNVELWEAEYSQVERQVMDPTSDLHQFGADYVVVFQSSHKLLETYSLSGVEKQEQMADERLDFVSALCQQVSGRIIYYNYPEIDDTVFGSYATKVVSSFTYQLAKLNFGLMNLSQEYKNLFVCDLAGLTSKLGRDMMFDTMVYTSTEMILSIDSLPYVASRTNDIIAAAEGRFKKCLILDLDNTVWGGVVGDDGWENIQVGHGLGIGKAFTEFQQWVKKLKNRGIIICVCSKNEGKESNDMISLIGVYTLNHILGQSCVRYHTFAKME